MLKRKHMTIKEKKYINVCKKLNINLDVAFAAWQYLNQNDNYSLGYYLGFGGVAPAGSADYGIEVNLAVKIGQWILR